MSTVLNSGAVLHQVSCLFSFVSVCDAFQEQYELVYQAVLELFKRQMDVIRDQHLGTEVSIQPDIVSLFFSYLILVKGSQISCRTQCLLSELNWSVSGAWDYTANLLWRRTD